MSAALPLVKIPRLNTIKLYEVLSETPFCESFPNWYQSVKYSQVFSRFDNLIFQIMVEDFYISDEIEPIITCVAYDVNDLPVYTFTVNNIFLSPGLNGYTYSEVNEVLTGLAKGFYYLKVNVKNYDVSSIPFVLLNEYNFYSEPIYVEDQPENTVIIKYTHENNNKGEQLCVNIDNLTVTGVTTPLTANQCYPHIITYNGEKLFRADNNNYLIFYSTTLQGGSVWVIQANAGVSPNESASDYAYCTTLTGTYTNVGTWAGTTGIDYTQNYFYHRLKGGFKYEDFSMGDDQVDYIDEERDSIMLHDSPYTSCKLSTGDEGIPSWQAIILGFIFSCSEFYVNNAKYTKNSGAKWEKKTEENYPLIGWSIELCNPSPNDAKTYGNGDYNSDYNDDYFVYS